MKINLLDIDENGLSIDISEELEGINDGFKKEACGISFISPVNAHLDIERAGSKIFVRGTLELDARIDCARCLTDFNSHIHSDINLVFLKSLEKGDEKEISKTSADINYYTGDDLDITDILMEQIMLDLPVKPLCKPECKGLCSKCGVDLNKGKCSCSQERQIDTRFKKLMEFKREKN